MKNEQLHRGSKSKTRISKYNREYHAWDPNFQKVTERHLHTKGRHFNLRNNARMPGLSVPRHDCTIRTDQTTVKQHQKL